MNLSKIIPLLIVCILQCTNSPAQNNTNHYEALEQSTWDGILGNDYHPNNAPLTLAEIGVVPVEIGVAIGGSKLIRKYLRSNEREYNIWKKILPEETSALEEAKANFEKINVTWKKRGQAYDQLESSYIKARDGYTYSKIKYQKYNYSEASSNYITQTGYTYTKVKYEVAPNKLEALILKPLMNLEGNRLGSLLTDYKGARASMKQAEKNFEMATDEILIGSRRASEEARFF